MTTLRLSVLDQSTAAQGRGEDAAIRETLALARHCDALGYHRYWVSEHHNSGSIVGTAPEVLMAAIAATTRAHPRRQRRRDAAALLGAQGGRAVSRARGDRARAHRPRRRPRARLGSPDRARAQSRTRTRPRNSPRQVHRPAAWVAGDAAGATSHPFRDIVAHPRGADDRPSCGSWAARTMARSSRRTSGCRTRTRISSATARASRRRSRFIASTTARAPRHPMPQATICVWALAADTDDEARRLLQHARILARRLRAGHPPAAGVAGGSGGASVYDGRPAQRIDALRRKAFVGTARRRSRRACRPRRRAWSSTSW